MARLPSPPQVVPWRNVLLGGRTGTTSLYRAPRAEGKWHTGVDFGAKIGTEIRIPAGGTVVAAGWGAGGGGAFGNAVLVRLKNGDYMYFAHLSHIAVEKGQELKAGAYVGKSGATGNVTGPHLHLEIRKASSGGKWSRNDSTFYEPISYLNALSRNGNVTISDPVGRYPTGFQGLDALQGGGGGGGFGGGGGGGKGVGRVAFSKKEFYADLETMFGDFNTLLEIDEQAVKENGGKSIRWAVDEAVKQKITDSDRFLTLLNKTAWFKKYGRETTKRMIEEKSKPALFLANRDQTAAAIAQHAANLGIRLDAKVLERLARDAYVYQWDATSATVLDRIQKSVMGGQGKFVGGTIGETLEAMDEHARLFGVKLSDADVKQLRNDILDGHGDQRMKDVLQERSAQTYSVFADQIRKGVNLRTIADPYFRSASELLELSIEQLDMNDPLFLGGKAFQATDPGSGKVVQRSLSDFLSMVRKDVRWSRTENAKKTAMEMTSGILAQMGLIR